MVGRTEFAVGHPRTHATQNDVVPAVGHVRLDLLERPAREEGGGRADERNESGAGEAGADSDEVLLGDADVDQTVGEFVAEADQVARPDRVVADRDDPLVTARQGDEFVGERDAIVEADRVDSGRCS